MAKKKGFLALAASCMFAGAMAIGFATSKQAEPVKADATSTTLTTNALSGTSSDGYVSWTSVKGGSGTAPSVYNNGIRLYQNGGFIELHALEGAKITGFEASNNGSYAGKANYAVSETTFGTAKTPSYDASNTTSVAKNSTYTVEGLDSTYVAIICAGTDKNTRLEITSITVSLSTSSPTKTLTSITVSGEPTKTTYNDGESLNTAGLVVTGTYDDESTSPITAGITWSVNPTALKAGDTSCKVTATVGELTSDEYEVTGLTVNATPFYTHKINASGTGFAEIKVDEKKTSCAETAKLSEEYWTVTGESSASIRIAPAGTTGQCFGTTNNPFTHFELTSNNFGNKKISFVTVKLKGAASDSAISVEAYVGGVKLGDSKTYNGNIETEVSFAGTDLFGAVEFKFTNITKGMYITAISITGSEATTNEALANGFARTAELENTCSLSHTDIIATYNALSAEVKSLADAITIHDWNGVGEDKGARTLEMTVANKMAALESESQSTLIRNNIVRENTSLVVIVVALLAVAGIATIGYASIRRRNHK